MTANIIVVNKHILFTVPDSKLEETKAFLFAVCEGAQSTPPEKQEFPSGPLHQGAPGPDAH